MKQTVQFAIADAAYAAVLRDTLTRSGPWQVVSAALPDPNQQCVVVMDEDALDHLPRPLSDPQRVVLITRKDPQHLSRAWDAGIVSVVSTEDSPDTVLLAIMAAALRIRKCQMNKALRVISPTAPPAAAPITPESGADGVNQRKIR